jgi:hypothetical protein
MISYSERLKSPHWQRRRLEILSRANFRCEMCESTEKTLHVHHKLYRKGAMPWEYEDHELQALCADCHENTEHWRGLLSAAVARIDTHDLETLVGFAEGMVAYNAVFLAYEDARSETWPVRSYEHAIGLAKGLLYWNAHRDTNVVDCMCDLKSLTAEHVDLLGEGYPLPTPGE